MDTRGHWVTVAAVLAIHIWIHCPMCDSGCSAADTHMDTRGQCGDSGCSAFDTHMNTHGQCGDIGCSAGDTLMDTRTGNWKNMKHRHVGRPANHVRDTLQN